MKHGRLLIAVTVYAAALAGSHVFPIRMNPQNPFVVGDISRTHFLSSYLPFACWWLAMGLLATAAAILIRRARPERIDPLPAPGPVRAPTSRHAVLPGWLVIAGFLVLPATALFSGYMHTMIVKGDSMDNLSYAMGVARGNFEYQPLAYLGYWKQLLYFQLAAPLCRVMGLSDRLPNTALILTMWAAALSLYFLLRSLSHARLPAFAAAAAMFFAVPFMVWQGTFLRQHAVPVFLCLAMICYHNALSALDSQDGRRTVAHTLLLGLVIGLGFNLYDLNYVFGVMAAALFTAQTAACVVLRRRLHGKWIAAIQAALLLGIVTGTGPLASLYLDSPHILLARLKRTGDVVNYLANFRVVLGYHWMNGPERWIPAWSLALVIPGLVLLLRRNYRHLRWLIPATLLLLTAVFVQSGHEGRRRAISLLVMEYALMGITLNSLYRLLRQKAPAAKAWVSGGAIGLLGLALAGGNFLDSLQVRQKYDQLARIPQNSILLDYFHAIRDLSHLRHVYAFEPLESTSAVFWSGGRPAVHRLREPRNHRPEAFLSEDDIRDTVADLARSGESFAFIFWLQDDLTTYLNVPLGPEKHAFFQGIAELETVFLAAMDATAIPNVEKKTVFVKNRFLVRMYYRE